MQHVLLRLFEDRGEDLFLVGEVGVEGSGRAPGGLGDVGEFGVARVRAPRTVAGS